MIERIVEGSARHRGWVLLAALLAAIGSWMAYRNLALDALPDLGDPQVTVVTEWMGRSPTLIEDQVTAPLVAALLATPHATDVRGTSMLGMSFIQVLFTDSTSPAQARAKVQEQLAAVSSRLPAGAISRLGPDATGVGWVFQYVLVDDAGELRPDELRSLQETTLRPALTGVEGVAEVAGIGGFERQYQVTVDPLKLQSRGLVLADVVTAVRAATGEVGARVLELAGREVAVRARGNATDAASLELAVIAPGRMGEAPPVLVRDVATVRLGPNMRRGLLDWNGDGEAVGGIVVMRQGENARAVIGRVKAKLDEVKTALPKGVRVETAYDRSELIDGALATLRRALVEEALVVALVILLFLLHFRSALLPALSLPMTVGLSFVPMWLFDIPATLMSLGGIAIAIGATVDAEIVMIESAHKRLENAPPEADRTRLLAEAAREVTPAIFASLLVVAIAFLPVFTLTGEAGRLFRPLALTKTFVMLASAIVSITFAPALRHLLLKGKIRPEAEHPVSRFIHRVYEPFVELALRRPKSTLAIGLFAVLSAVPIAGRLGQEFMPAMDEGDLLYMPTTLPGIAIQEAREQLQRQDEVLMGFPEVVSVFGKAGRAETATDPAPLSMFETTIRLKPRDAWRRVEVKRWWHGAPETLRPALEALWPSSRPMNRDELIAEFNRTMAFPGWTSAFTAPVRTRIDMLATGIRTPVGVKLLGDDLKAIDRTGAELEALLATLPGTRSAFFERSGGGSYVDITPDREALARNGLTVAELNAFVEQAVGGEQVASVTDGRARIGISVRYPQDWRSSVEKLRALQIPIGGGAGAMPSDGKQGARQRPANYLYAQNMNAMSMERGPASTPSRGTASTTATDAPSFPVPRLELPRGTNRATPFSPGSSGGASLLVDGIALRPHVRLGEVADVRIVSGPAMVRDEDGRLAGYLSIDLDESADPGSWLERAKARVEASRAAGQLTVATGTTLAWTGQFEQLREMNDRLKWVVPLTLLLIGLLLYLQFRSVTEALIVLLSVPFALVGSVWLLWLLDYRMSTAVWVGLIALCGLAAQTGIVMIVYIDQAYLRRKAAGLIRNLDDIVAAHLEGTVQRVRPKLMTVATMLAGLVPLLWAEGPGADVMRRIAAPMVGGLLSSAFLTLELIPVVYTAWRHEQLVHEKLAAFAPGRATRLAGLARLHGIAWLALAVTAVLPLYIAAPAPLRPFLFAAATATLLFSAALYLLERRRALPSLEIV